MAKSEMESFETVVNKQTMLTIVALHLRMFAGSWLCVWTSIIVLFQPTVACLKLSIKTLEQGAKYKKVPIKIVNFEHVSHLAFLLLTLSR